MAADVIAIVDIRGKVMAQTTAVTSRHDPVVLRDGEFMLPGQQILLQLLVIAVLGSLVCLERERLNWVMGLRNHMSVGVGVILFMATTA
jgi:hypothetical protein